MKRIERAWKLAPSPAIPASILDLVEGNEVVARALLKRGISSASAVKSFIDPEKYHPFSPLSLPEIFKAVEIINQTINQKHPILVWGDFDVDGQTSTAVLVSSLQVLGADVSFHVPLRSTEGHGIKTSVLKDHLPQDGGVLISCDTGIDAYEAVEFAKSAGVKVIITDHHQLPKVLPKADVIINPQTLPVEHPIQTLSGAGVAFLLASAVLEANSRKDEVSNLADLAAIGLVADLVELQRDCRYIVQKGITELRNPQRLSIQSLLTNSEINPSFLNEEHISFSIAPRLNAIGRLGDANEAVKFLLSNDEKFIDSFCRQVEKLNGDRKLLVDQVFKAALAQIESSLSSVSDPILVVAGTSWPAGVLGLVASRLTGLYFRPAMVLSLSADGIASGSARSIEGINIYDALSKCKDLFLNFGGHPMAAGLSLREKDLPEFKRRIKNLIGESSEYSTFESELQVDEMINFDQITLDNVQPLERLAPFGPGNQPVIFSAKSVTIEKIIPIGKNREHLSLTLRDGKSNIAKMIWWQGAGNPLPEIETQFDVAFKLRTSNFKGTPEVQMEWIDWRESPPDSVSSQTLPKYEYIDHRRDLSPEKLLIQYSTQPDTMLWGEGITLPNVKTFDRTELVHADTLVCVTSPPGRNELQNAVELIAPRRIVLFSILPENLNLQSLIKKVTGMWKFAESQSKYENIIERMAASLNIKEIVVELSLKYLFLQDHFPADQNRINSQVDHSNIQENDPEMIITAIKMILQETQAFREFYLRAKPEELFE